MELTACTVHGPRWIGGRRPGTVEERDIVGGEGDAIDGDGGRAATGQNSGEIAVGSGDDEIPGQSSELIELWRRKGVAGAKRAVFDQLEDMNKQIEMSVPSP